MKEELEEIGIALKKWCEKYGKNYASVSYIEHCIIGMIDTKDKDYKKTNVFINFNE